MNIDFKNFRGFTPLTGFTLLEVILVVVIIGILSTLALPQFFSTKERALDNEAKANLKLIQAAQKIYRMETGSYANCTGPWEGNQEACINPTLKLSLLIGSARNWNYETRSSDGCAHCKRIGQSRYFYIRIADNAVSSGTCP